MAAETGQQTGQQHLVFFHPDLGIGGAERLVVDAAVGLQSRGHRVTIFTGHRDPQHCFDEARDGTLDVWVGGNSVIPPSVLSRFSILCAILRQVHLIIEIYLSAEFKELRPDAFFVDQLSAGLPLLRYLWPDTPILFYCHFPDLLLAKGRSRLLKRLYRRPFDWLEQWSMGFADAVVVNSEFTKAVVSDVWPQLAKNKKLEVVYPCVNVRERGLDDEDGGVMWQGKDIVLSINRFEEKKNIELAIEAYGGLGRQGQKGSRLVIAGGYDSRIQENVAYHKALVEVAKSLGLKTATAKNVVTALGVSDDIDVLFLLSVPNKLKESLLRSARLVLYTPANEHFGIVPLEAMLAGTPVLATNTGGPLETVVPGLTGWLCSPNDLGGWCNVLHTVLHELSDAQLKKMGDAARARVTTEFSDTKMAERLDGVIAGMTTAPRKSSGALVPAVTLLSTVLVVAVAAGAALWKIYGY